MKGEIEVYWVILCKHDEPLYAVAGPFGDFDQALDAEADAEEPSGACYLQIMTSKITVERN